MLKIPVLRWGKPYESMEYSDVAHFITGEPIAKVAQANGGIVQRDMKQARKAREALKAIPIPQLIEKMKTAGELYLNATLPMGDGTQSPEEFAHQQSASTGLPEHMCKANMTKNHFVLSHMREMLDALTRGLDPEILSRGYGVESRGVVVSYQAQTSVLSAVLPSNSPGVHTLWLPVVPMQFGLALKPGSQEIWTPYRMIAAFIAAGVPAEAFSLYPGGHDVGGALLSCADRSMIFGSAQTVESHKGNPKVQPHGPGFSKFIFGDDLVDQWEKYIDIIADSIYLNSGRGCINASSVWASRHTKEIADALAQKLGPIEVKPPTDPTAALAAFTVPGQAKGVWELIEKDLKEAGVTHCTEKYGPRLVEMERCAYLRPVIAHCDSHDKAIASKEYMFPFTSVVKCPQNEMLAKIGPTLVCTAITGDEKFIGQLTDATHIDRLNIGAIPTIKLDWLQPHEGNIIDFLFRSRAYQMPAERLAKLQTA